MSHRAESDDDGNTPPAGPHQFRKKVKQTAPQTKKKRKTWDEHYDDLVAYQRKFGDCNVPFRSGPLGKWVSKQKRVPPTADRRARLDQIGFNWNKQNARFDEKWNEQYERLKKFKREHGHCNIVVTNCEDPVLGQWVSSQRGLYQKGQLRDDRKEQLEEIGLEWRIKDCGQRSTARHDQAFQDMYDRLLEFREQNGHCLVPVNYAADKSLASWVANQRTKFSKNDIPKKRIDMLNEVGFVWKVDPYDAENSLHQRHWNDMFKELTRYHERHGHTQVPTTSVVNGKKLGMWVNMQRTFRRGNDPFLTAERIAKLNSIGFWWGKRDGQENTPLLEENWDEHYQELVSFKQVNGHVMPSINKSKKEKNLAIWINTQRRLHIRGKLQVDHQARLESLGIEWEGNKARINHQWMTMYGKLHKFHTKMGHCNVPSTYKDQKLARWVWKQRSKASDAEYMIDSRKQLLNSIGFTWSIGKGQYDRSNRKRKRDNCVEDDGEDDTSGELEYDFDESEDDGDDDDDDDDVTDDEKKEGKRLSSLVGKNIATYWPDDDAYYRGRIVQQRSDGEILVKYEDGDEEWVSSDEVDDRCHLDIDPDDPLPPRRVSPPLSTVKVGCRISIWMPHEEQYAEATVKKIKIKDSKRRYKLIYSNGETERSYLSNRKFQVLSS